MPAKKPKRWVASVKTESTHPPEDLFTKSASTISRMLASKKVSPKGPSSGLRMLTFFINRAGKGLDVDRRAELEKAKALLSSRVRREKRRREKKQAKENNDCAGGDRADNVRTRGARSGHLRKQTLNGPSRTGG